VAKMMNKVFIFDYMLRKYEKYNFPSVKKITLHKIKMSIHSIQKKERNL